MNECVHNIPMSRPCVRCRGDLQPLGPSEVVDLSTSSSGVRPLRLHSIPVEVVRHPMLHDSIVIVSADEEGVLLSAGRINLLKEAP